MSHTPGPWFTEATSRIGHVAICDSDGFTVCNPSPMGADNARLIAAAPDLLAALESLNAAVIRAGYGNTAMPELSQAWEAIAKATGETEK